jgi:hypothetical protein
MIIVAMTATMIRGLEKIALKVSLVRRMRTSRQTDPRRSALR